MTTDVTTATRADLHALVDALPDPELAEAKRLLTGLSTTDDPVLRAALLAPLEDEELSPEEEAILADARARRARGDVHYTSNDDLRREIGW